MSEENIAVVQAAFDAFNRGDFEAGVALFHPEAEWYPYLGALEASVYRGREALRTMWAELSENFGNSLRFDVEELIDLGDQVIALIDARGTGTTSGAEVHRSWAQLATLEDGQIVRVEPFQDEAAAREAAGA